MVEVEHKQVRGGIILCFGSKETRREVLAGAAACTIPSHPSNLASYGIRSVRIFSNIIVDARVGCGGLSRPPPSFAPTLLLVAQALLATCADP
eukprot:scaffold272838_cov28-Tisochrysis_lutea.AAC.2